MILCQLDLHRILMTHYQDALHSSPFNRVELRSRPCREHRDHCAAVFLGSVGALQWIRVAASELLKETALPCTFSRCHLLPQLHFHFPLLCTS